MSAFSWLYKNTEQRSGVANPAEWLVNWVTGGKSSSGISVTPNSALKYTPVWAAVNIISGVLGYLPLFVYKRTDDGKEKDPSNRQFKKLHTRPNPHMSSQDFRETLQGHVVTWGNGYAEIERRGDGEAEWYWPLRPDLTAPILNAAGELFYEVRHRDGSEPDILPARNVLHIKGLGGNGYQGYSVISYHAEAIGLGKATEKYGSVFFGNDATPSGLLTHPGKLEEGARENLRREFEDKHKGLDNAHRIGILQEGIEWTSIGIPAKDAQLLESKTFSVLDISRIFQIPPHMLAEMSSATFSNIEEQNIKFIQMTMLRWLTKWEMEIDFKVLPDTHFSKFVVEGLLRGNSAARSKFYREMAGSGFLTVNQVLEFENMNTIGPAGDRHLVNSALKDIEDVGKDEAPPESDEADADSFRALILDLCGRVARRECKSPVKNFVAHRTYIQNALRAAIETICESTKINDANSSSQAITAELAQSWMEKSIKDKPTDWKQLRDDRCEMIIGVLKNAITDTK